LPSLKTQIAFDCLTHREHGWKPLHLSFFRWQLLQAEAALLRCAERRAFCKIRLNSTALIIKVLSGYVRSKFLASGLASSFQNIFVKRFNFDSQRPSFHNHWNQNPFLKMPLQFFSLIWPTGRADSHTNSSRSYQTCVGLWPSNSSCDHLTGSRLQLRCAAS
jgi:hypothetical protein